ncbi:hypothetical protein DFJ74DRAFT_706626 [Hyaloraphidium curvatum]|nr:hypothetical protein DFJ74DRAFT_706626 [Hyaloraphidium curvatum]
MQARKHRTRLHLQLSRSGSAPKPSPIARRPPAMPAGIAYHVRATVKDGKLADAEQVIANVLAESAKLPGTIEYAAYVTPDGKELHVYEAYDDPQTAIDQADVLVPFLDRVGASCEFTDIWVFGDDFGTGEDAKKFKEMLLSYGAKFMRVSGKAYVRS